MAIRYDHATTTKYRILQGRQPLGGKTCKGRCTSKPLEDVFFPSMLVCFADNSVEKTENTEEKSGAKVIKNPSTTQNNTNTTQNNENTVIENPSKVIDFYPCHFQKF